MAGYGVPSVYPCIHAAFATSLVPFIFDLLTATADSLFSVAAFLLFGLCLDRYPTLHPLTSDAVTFMYPC